jgi:glycosyltransferase involved in cell wall biosynthesis
MGYRVAIQQSWDGSAADALIALHARKSADSIRRFSKAHPDRPVVLALTGTDLYLDLPRSVSARRSLQMSDRIVALNPAALDELPKSLHAKTRVILQSFDPADLPIALRPKGGRNAMAAGTRRASQAAIGDCHAEEWFEVCVLAHLRQVKDPLFAARAARHLPGDSRVRILLMGGIVEPSYERKLHKEAERNPRLEWLGNLPRPIALQRLRRSDLLVNSSRIEGGANAVSEAIALGVPVLASDIPGNVGLLGESYPGYFPRGDEESLTLLLQRCEEEPRFLRSLSRYVARLAPRFHPAREARSWKKLLAELGLTQ